MALLGGAAISLGLVPIDHLPVAAAVVATVGFSVMAVGMGLATPLMSTLALDLSPVGRQGESGGAIQMSDALGQSIAAGLVGAVFARWFLVDENTSYLAGFGLAVVLAVLAIGLTRRCLTETRPRAERSERLAERHLLRLRRSLQRRALLEVATLEPLDHGALQLRRVRVGSSASALRNR